MPTFMLNCEWSPSGRDGLPFASRTYSPYGVMNAASHPVLAFCGQYRDPLTGSYPLGNGHRSYSPSLMRFHSPDKHSPFDVGGLNAYSYCLGDPVNHRDPSGRAVEDKLLPIMVGLANVLSLFISGLKFRAMRLDRKLTSPTGGFPASRSGVLTYGTPEIPIVKPARMDWLMSSISAGSALGGLGFSIARVVDPDKDAYLWVAAGLTTVGLLTSGVEAWQLFGDRHRVRYPIDNLHMTRIESPIPRASIERGRTSAASIREPSPSARE
jgi:RHS repeat-associated protein